MSRTHDEMNLPQQVSVVLTRACSPLSIVALTTVLCALFVHLLVKAKANARGNKRRTVPGPPGANESHVEERAVDDGHRRAISSSPRVTASDANGAVGEGAESASMRKDEKRGGEAKESAASSSENGEGRKKRGDSDDSPPGRASARGEPNSGPPTSKSLPSPSPSPMMSGGRDREEGGDDDEAPADDGGGAPSTETATAETKSRDRREQQTWRCACEQGFLPAGMLRSFGGAEAVFRMSAGQCYHKR